MDWLGIGSAVLGAFGDVWSTNQANAANAAALEKQMAFNKEVMQNRHQWEVEDLRAAGLNPLMSTTSPTGTLSAPTSSPAQKANLANTALAVGQMRIQDRQAEAALNSSRADLFNAETNKINAQTSANTLQETIRRNQQDYQIASSQVAQGWKDLNIQEVLAKANVKFIDAQRVEQEVVNSFATQREQENLNYIQGQIVNEAKVAAATVENLIMTGEAAQTSAAAAMVASNAQAALNEKLGQLTDAQREQVFQDMALDLASHNSQVWQNKLNELFAKYDYMLYGDPDHGYELYRGREIIKHIPIIGSGDSQQPHTLGIRFGKRFGYR